MLWLCVMPIMASGKAERHGGKQPKGRETACLSPEREAQFYYNFYVAQQAMNDGRYDQAFCLFRLCSDINPTDARTQDYLGIIYDALRLKDSARVAYARAYAYAPKEFYQHHVSALMDQGKMDEAFTIMRSAIKVDSDNADAWNMLLHLAMAKEDYRTAKNAIDQIDALLGPSPYGALVRYQIAVQQKNIKKAFSHLDTYLEMVPDNPTILNDYAYMLAIHKGDLDRAEQMSAQAIRIEPNNSSFLDTYGWILHLKGQDSLAQFYLNKALNLSNDPNERKIILQHLEKTK